MSEVNKINLNDTLFDIEDTVARENITTMQANIANDLDACSLVAEEDKSIAGAYAVQQLNRSLGGLRFGTDGEGNYGYFGADDSLIPFKGDLTFVYSNYYCGYTTQGTNTWQADKDYDTLYVFQGGMGTDSHACYISSGSGNIEVLKSQNGSGHYSINSSAYKVTDIKAGSILTLSGSQYAWMIFSM